MAGNWETPDGQLPRYNVDEVVRKFNQALYNNDGVTSAFQWTEWQESAMRFVATPTKIEKADAKTILKLLTTHVRADRFCEGPLASMFENGHIVELLRRVKAIREQTRRP